MASARMRRQRMRRRFVAFLAGYFVIAVAGLAVLRSPAKYEVFPFSAWPLFMITPADGAEYGLRLPIDGRHLYLEDITQPPRIEAYAITQTLGAAIEKGRDAKRLEMIDQLNRRYLWDVRNGVTIEVVRRSFDPVARHRTGLIDSETVIGTFERANP